MPLPGIRVGDRFGKLTIIEGDGYDHAGRRFWKAVCDCRSASGQWSTRCREDHLRSGKKRSCGCQRVTLMWGNQRARKNGVGDRAKDRGYAQATEIKSHVSPLAHAKTSAPLRGEGLRGLGYTAKQTPFGVCAHGKPVDDPRLGTARKCSTCRTKASSTKAWNVVLRKHGLPAKLPERDGRGKFVLSGYDVEEIHAHVVDSENSLISRIYEGASQKGYRRRSGANFRVGSGGLEYWDGKRKRTIKPIYNEGYGPDEGSDDFVGENYDIRRGDNYRLFDEIEADLSEDKNRSRGKSRSQKESE